MILVKTPMRVSLLGGGSDFPEHFREHGGCVLGMAIDKYCWVTVRRLPPFFEHKHRLVYSKVETVRDAEDFAHPMVRECLKAMQVKHGLEIHHDADLPARAGMGSSSAFTVGLVQALAALRGEMLTKRQLAESAIHVERDLIPETGGWQDQIWAAYGGLNAVDFSDGFAVSPLILTRARRNELTSSMVLYFTGFARDAHTIEETKVPDTMALRRLSEMAREGWRLLVSETPLRDFGLLMTESWKLKRSTSPAVSTSDIDEICRAGIAAGAWGCKLLGAGGGGFVLFLCPYERRASLRSAMRGRIEINVEVDYDGSRVVLYQPNGW